MNKSAVSSARSATSDSKPRTVAIASLIGTTLEWYDFYLYGAAAALVFNKQYFTTLSPTAGTLAAFATFAVGFFARPLGGIIFGHFGDRIGRRATLVVSLLTMGLASMLVGVTPTYATIGVWAPILLVVLRLAQGIGLGGETSGAVLMSVEHAPSGRSNYWGGFPQMGVPAGLVLANLVYFLATTLSSEAAFTGWVWRIPFLLSAALVGIGLLIRLRLTESPRFRTMQEQSEIVTLPAWTALKSHWLQIIATVLMVMANSTCSYVFTVFSLSYGSTNLHLNRQLLLLFIVCGSLIWMGSIPLWSRAADRHGRRKVFLFGSVALPVAAVLYFPIFNHGTLVAAALAFLTMALTTPISHALQGSIMAAVFPPTTRYSGMGIILGLGSMIGGTAPLIASALLAVNGTTVLITGYLVGACTLSLVAALALFRSAPQLDASRDPAPEPVLVLDPEVDRRPAPVAVEIAQP